MAGVMREISDPVEAAKHDVGSSRRLIAATLDDLSDHHSWLETYHRDERLRAERLRRRELRDRIERRYNRTAGAAKHGARTSYIAGRGVARVAKRHARAFARWAAPRLRSVVLDASEMAAAAWRWSRQHTPLFTHRAFTAASTGFQWSVQASEDAGYVFRRRAAGLADNALNEVLRYSGPVRRRAACEWTGMRQSARRSLASANHRMTGCIATSRTLALLRSKLRRWTIRAVHVSAPPIRRMHAAVTRVETRLSTRIIRIAPEFRRLLQDHLPGAKALKKEAPKKQAHKKQAPRKTVQGRIGRALILRPSTALACIGPIGNRLPVPYRA